MKSFWCICLWLLSSLGSCGQAEGSRRPQLGEVVCGYAGSFQRIESGRHRSGLSVELLAGDAIVNQPLPLRFRVVQQPQETPVDDLQIEHEKHMHVIGVRDDLGELIHLHPQRTSPGLWEIIHTFTNAGRYQIWSDIKHRGTVYSFAHPRLTVPSLQEPSVAPQGFGRPGEGEIRGEGMPVRRTSGPKLTDETGGFHLTLQPTSSTLIAGRTSSFEVNIRDRWGNQVGTEFFLGALMHLIIVKDDLSTYAHAHAAEHLKSRQPVSFQHVFPWPGDYKLFAQFRPQKTSLPPDEALLAEFWVRVERGN